MDVQNYSKRLEAELRKINEFHEEDRKDILRFAKYLKAKGITDGRIRKYLQVLRVISKILGKSLRKATREDIENVVAEIESRNYTEWTKHDYKRMLKIFYRWLYGMEDEGEYPEIVKWIKPKPPKGQRLPEEILTEEDIEKLVSAATNVRDKALVLCLYESGCRIGEFLNMKLKHVQFDENGASFIVSGKTGMRRIRVFVSTKFLQEWVSQHPSKFDPEAWLWIDTRKNDPKPLTYEYVRKLLRELAKRAGIKKRVNPHAFRHARATSLSKWLTDAQMKKYFGWSMSSKMPAIYVHLSGKDVDETLMEMYGIKKEERKLVLTLRSCPRCGAVISPGEEFCNNCWLPLTNEAMVRIEKVRKLEDVLIKFFEKLGEVYPEAKRIFREVVKEMKAEDVFKN